MAINKGAKIGITIQIIALIIMIILVLFDKLIPSILSCFFGIGIAIALVENLIKLSKNIKVR